ncbi:hypothetical protein GTW43_28830 [Streptomyces sp. SID5785]|uniref:hypothetical protein n=1 Tax=Streptomyces sp. SID5785 TaxID=2690309 RepID=UPI0013612973|nr:hypothetical protein [Streptomyces sp. SID5785]MZD09053.1 hypothetical protein [Streptomyces sp. SID5785]
MEQRTVEQQQSSEPTDTPIYETVVRLWSSRGRTLPRQAAPARQARGWVRVDAFGAGAPTRRT